MLLNSTVTFIASLLFAAPLYAAGTTAQDIPVDRTINAAADTTMAEGEIRKVDPGTKKITIKHGELKNLDMPAMTMVFQVKDPIVLEQVKAGDKVKFRADKLNGVFTVTEIEVVK